MGIFNSNRAETDVKRAERLQRECKARNNPQGRQLSEALAQYQEDEEYRVIRPFSLFLDVIEVILANPNFARDTGKDTLRYGENIYRRMFFMDENTPEFEQLSRYFLEMFDRDGVVARRFFLPELYDLFFEPANYLRLVRLMPTTRLIEKEKKYIVDFATQIRGYCSNEEMFTTTVAAYVARIAAEEDPKTVATEIYTDFRRLLGIYSVSEERIATAEQKLDAVELATGRLSDTLNLSEERMRAAAQLSESTLKTVKNFTDGEVARVTSRVNSLTDTMRKEHAAFVENQQAIVFAQRDELINSVVSESREKLTELRKEADGISAKLREEILWANRESASVIAKTDEFLRDNTRIQEVFANADESRELSRKIDKLMVLNDTPVNTAQHAANAPAEAGPVDSAGTGAAAGVYLAGPREVGHFPEIPEEREIPPVSPLLDTKIPFRERFETAMKVKEDMANQGVLFHRMFDDVLTAVMENSNPYLIGPSGCGKTYMVRQIASILSLDYVDIGYINEEYDILGFQTANGGYSRPNFYRCYKYGKIAFCDELDNGNSRATVKLNSFLTNTEEASYSFPNGENVPRHPNFRIVAAGNTTGNGADENYNSREKIEESVQQRFTPIYVGYDNQMEEEIMIDYPEWFRFLVAFRAATDAWAKHTHAGAAGIITTRDASKICRYLDNGSFGAQKILEYEFIQTKDEEYLEFLDKNLRDQLSRMTKPYAEIYKLFHDRVQEIITGKDTLRTV
ncbi:MAG: AAA family ATPase [Lachnospiraceae bacterium]|nr:AAA family ATPase [Lachnospiraceae bacterium]